MRNKENIHIFAHRSHLRYSSVARFPHFLHHLRCAGGQTGVVHNRLGTSLRHLNVMVDQFKGQCCSLCPKVYCEKSSTLAHFLISCKMKLRCGKLLSNHELSKQTPQI